MSGTRTAILDAARRQFGGLGYDRTTVRSIAAEAAVDPALVTHFFGSKQRLFLAAMDLPFEPEVAVPRVLRGRRTDIGRRFAELIVSTVEDPAARNVVTGIVRSAASEPEAARIVRELIGERVVGVVARELGVADAELRASLAGSQVVGLVMARYVVGVEPIASLPPDRIVGLLAPTFQRYLAGSLDAA